MESAFFRKRPRNRAMAAWIIRWCGRPFRRKVMDWRDAMLRTEQVRATPEDETAYAAGWTISGLATLGTIIAVWMFAI